MARGNLSLVPSLESARTPLGGVPVEAMSAPDPEVVKDDEYYLENYAITLAEAQQEVQYVDRKGELHKERLGVVLDEHEDCPIGGWVARAKQEGDLKDEVDGGRKAVEAKLRLFGEMATEFTVDLDTKAYRAKKKLLGSCSKSSRLSLSESRR